ncbi:MAG: Rrf2 family transcriptional regulator [Nitrospirae bacterium]|nr:Rrf2 family transcriptional regulator [Nitrospirota bacterium]MBI3359140.1 Rrf2 family transcriptional regulator [Candidatus Troglogloeales bacterium]MBI3597971.1 Rrf2 family transcriptional regulator [Candidatus Troglogloeales bacterium]
MFKLSVKVEYGILAVLALSLHEERGAGTLSVRSIAEKERLSIRFLEQAMNDLKERGVIGSVRGPRGGYHLLKSPREITLSDVILAVEGLRESSVSSSKPKILNEIVDEVDTALEGHLQAIDFDTLSRRARELTDKEALMFYI